MMTSICRSLVVGVLILSGCGAPSETDDVAAALLIAQDYVDGYYHQFPEEAFEIAYPDTPMDRLGDRSGAGMDAWHAREDAWLKSLHSIDSASLDGTRAAVPYAFTLDRLEASVGTRVCNMEWWKVSATSNGWQAMLSSTFAVQPVDTPEQRADALKRLKELPGYIDTEVANLRTGMANGFRASPSNVIAVLNQVEALLDIEGSPFFSPAARANDAAFAQEVAMLLEESINPAIARYRDFLRDEYVPHESYGVGQNPDGAACYAASVRYHTSLNIDPQSIHETGLRQMDLIQAEMTDIAQKDFGTDDVPGLLQQFRTDPAYTFESEEEILAYARAAVDRGAMAAPDWFGYVPDAEIVVQPFPAYMKSSGGGYYSAGSPDGTRPGTYELGTYRPETISKAGLEATAFHESYPGHHLQFSVALFGQGVHPVLRYKYVASMAEGWGLYSELLADEMGIYSGPLDRLGMLSNQALRAARLVVDSGMHVLGWSRDQAVDYMLANTAESRRAVESEVDRYLATPAQATAYMIGSLEIQALRQEAEAELGERFDIKGFHDTVLADGAVSLPMLERAVADWAASL